MTFDIKKLGKISYSDAIQIQRVWSYKNKDDDLATILGAQYFNELLAGTDDVRFREDDVIFAAGSDDETILKVSSISPDIVVEPFPIPNNSVTTAKIVDGAVTKLKLASNLRPDAIIVKMSVFNSSSGTGTILRQWRGTTYEYLNGILSTDHIIINMINNPTPFGIVRAYAVDDGFDVEFSGNPTNTIDFEFSILRHT